MIQLACVDEMGSISVSVINWGITKHPKFLGLRRWHMISHESVGLLAFLLVVLTCHSCGCRWLELSWDARAQMSQWGPGWMARPLFHVPVILGFLTCCWKYSTLSEGLCKPLKSYLGSCLSSLLSDVLVKPRSKASLDLKVGNWPQLSKKQWQNHLVKTCECREAWFPQHHQAMTFSSSLPDSIIHSPLRFPKSHLIPASGVKSMICYLRQVWVQMKPCKYGSPGTASLGWKAEKCGSAWGSLLRHSAAECAPSPQPQYLQPSPTSTGNIKEEGKWGGPPSGPPFLAWRAGAAAA